MTRKDELAMIRRQGYLEAKNLQDTSSGMTGTELNEKDNMIPDFTEAVKKENMLSRKAGQSDGFVCRSSAERIVRLIQNYDSTVYLHSDGTPWEPEELPAQYRFVWSTDPAKAKPFIASATSYYNKGDCCLNKAGQPRRSRIDVNTFDPDVSPEFWEDPYSDTTLGYDDYYDHDTSGLLEE